MSQKPVSQNAPEYVPVDWSLRWLDTCLCLYKTHCSGASKHWTNYDDFCRWYALYPYGNTVDSARVWHRFGSEHWHEVEDVV